MILRVIFYNQLEEEQLAQANLDLLSELLGRHLRTGSSEAADELTLQALTA